MKARSAFFLPVALSSLLIFCGFTQEHSASHPALAASASRKLQHLQVNAARTPVDPAPTELQEGEINAYVASGNVVLPAGVRSVVFRGQPGIVAATASVDFDQIRAGTNSYNPLLSVFSGVHEVLVTAHARGVSGQGLVEVDSVQLDGVEIPRFVLQLFVDKYLKPKYPDIGLDSRFRLPARVEEATVGWHKVTVLQK